MHYETVGGRLGFAPPRRASAPAHEHRGSRRPAPLPRAALGRGALRAERGLGVTAGGGGCPGADKGCAGHRPGERQSAALRTQPRTRTHTHRRTLSRTRAVALSAPCPRSPRRVCAEPPCPPCAALSARPGRGVPRSGEPLRSGRSRCDESVRMEVRPALSGKPAPSSEG